MTRSSLCALAVSGLLAVFAGGLSAAAQDERSAAEGSRVEGRSEAHRAAPTHDRAHPPQEAPRGRPSIPRRPVPDYGRAPERTDVGDILLWIPRVIFFPVHFVLEYGVRVPLRLLFSAIELGGSETFFVHGMTQTPEEGGRQWWFFPVFRIDYGFLPSAGLRFHLRDPSDSHRLRLGLSFWGAEQVRGSARGSVRVDNTRFALGMIGSFRDDQIFHGFGWSSPSWPRARYAHAYGLASVSVRNQFWNQSVISAGIRAGFHRFSTSDFRQDQDVTIEQATLIAGLTPPPGYVDGYTAVGPWARLVVDSRPEGSNAHATGVRAEVHGSWAANVERGVDQSWARVGASFEAALEVMRDRSLHVTGMAELVEPLTGLTVPFTEQVVLGGARGRMPGFLWGRLMGLSGVTAGVSWRYAIWAWLDAELFVEIGNVFAEHFEDFAFERLRLVAGTALSLPEARQLTVLFAFGTEPFVFGADVSSGRVLLSLGLPP